MQLLSLSDVPGGIIYSTKIAPSSTFGNTSTEHKKRESPARKNKIIAKNKIFLK
jgi:hypothetical protein